MMILIRMMSTMMVLTRKNSMMMKEFGMVTTSFFGVRMRVTSGGFSITDDSSFRTKMDELLTDPTALETSGQAAGDFVKNSVGATDQILRQIHIR